MKNGSVNKYWFFALAMLVCILSMYARLGAEMADDGAFFLRYAENMVKGQFWVWNLGEAPVWGASAPLYPILIAIPIALGAPEVPALILTGIVLSASTLAALATLLLFRFGLIAGLAFLVFACLDTGITYFSGSGLETPLTFALLALGIWALLTDQKSLVVGLVSGFLMIHKLDLVPAGGLLLAALWVKDGRFPIRAVLIASACAVVWYGFAWWYFGAPVPNSFLTKSLHQNDFNSGLTWRWFGGVVLLAGMHPWLILLSLFAVLHRQIRPLVIFLGGLLLVHLCAYTIKYPFEPYDWYCMPSVLILALFGAIGLQFLTSYAVKRTGYTGNSMAFGFPIIVLAVIVSFDIKTELQHTTSIKSFLANQEFDRSEAGRWVNDNTPKSYVVYTMWGNPALYSKRNVIDGSFLNRRFDAADAIGENRPEVLIMQNNPGSTPMKPEFGVPHRGYNVVKVFAKTYSNGMDYFFAVLAREDLVQKFTGVETPDDLMRFLKNVKLGDFFGIVKPNDNKTLFVHPGRTTPTQFEFDTGAYRHDHSQGILAIDATIAQNVPEEVIRRGGGVAKLTIFDGSQPIAESVINSRSPFHFEIPMSNDQLRFVVGNNGVTDTNWLLISFSQESH